jgi:hypothetical protein
MRISRDLQIITLARVNPILKVNFGHRAYRHSARLRRDSSRIMSIFLILNMNLAQANTQANQSYGGLKAFQGL